VDATTKWLERSPFPINRIAFGGVLLSETKDRREGYQALKTLLKSAKVDPDEMRDVVFGVNWRAKSSVVSGLVLNRITNWSVAQISQMLLQLSAGALAPSSGMPESLSAVRLEMDLNTDQEHKDPFDNKDVVPIYGELVAMAYENAAKGERP
jgi:hypothetical protein